MSTAEKTENLVRRVLFQHTLAAYSLASPECVDEECLIAGARNLT